MRERAFSPPLPVPVWGVAMGASGRYYGSLPHVSEAACGRVEPVFSTLFIHSLYHLPCIHFFSLPSLWLPVHSYLTYLMTSLKHCLLHLFIYLSSVGTMNSCGGQRTTHSLLPSSVWVLGIELMPLKLGSKRLYPGSQSRLPIVHRFLLFGHSGTEVKKSQTALGPRQS